LEVAGKGVLNDAEFTFNLPIAMVRSKYSLGQKMNLQMDYNAFVFNEEEWLLELDES